MRRFHIENLGESPVMADDAITHHMQHVLRLAVGEEVILFGKGREVHARIAEYRPEGACLEILKEVPVVDSNSPKLHLIGALPKQQRLKFMIQKLGEVGLDVFTPLHAKRSVVVIPEGKLESRFEKWDKITQSSATQSGQRELLRFEAPVNCEDVIPCSGLNFVFSTEKRNVEPIDLFSALKEAPDVKEVTALIGPEGGFSSAELDSLEAKGFIPVRLNLPILRVETAAIAVCAIIKSFSL